MARLISQLTAASTPLAGTELVWIEQGGAPRKVAVTDIASGAGATQLDQLTDVGTVTYTNRNVLVADGTDFDARALEAADIQSGVFAVTRLASNAHGLTPASNFVEYNRFGASFDMDTLREPGQYGAGSATTNGPAGLSFDPLLVMASSSDVTSQLVIPRTASRGLAYRGETSDVFTSWHYAPWSTTEYTTDLRTLVPTTEVRASTAQQLVLNAGESASYNTGQTNEYIYANAEQGLEINASTDNWGSGWSNRRVTTINQFGIEMGIRADPTGRGRFLLIEGLASSAAGEGSARIFFTENNTTGGATADNYGLSLYYEGDPNAALPSGFQPNTGNATWSLRRHDNSVNGVAIMSGSRTNSNVTFGGSITAASSVTAQAAGGGSGVFLDSTESWVSGTLYMPALRWREADGTSVASMRGYVNSSGVNVLAIGTGFINNEVTISPNGLFVAAAAQYYLGSTEIIDSDTFGTDTFIMMGGRGTNVATYIPVGDTRDTDIAPADYNYAFAPEFKSLTTINLDGLVPGTYAGLLTFAPWSETSGDDAYQIAFTEGGMLYRQADLSATNWNESTKQRWSSIKVGVSVTDARYTGGSDLAVYYPRYAAAVYDSTGVTNRIGVVYVPRPVSTSNQPMLSMVIKGYDYRSETSVAGGGAWAIAVGGYPYSPNWVSTSACTMYGNPPFKTVRFFTDSVAGECGIILGQTDDDWEYPRFWVDEVMTSFKNTDLVEDAWLDSSALRCEILSATGGNWVIDGTESFIHKTVPGTGAFYPGGRIYPQAQNSSSVGQTPGNTVGYITNVTGNYGSIVVDGAAGSSGTWRGYSIGNRVVFMDLGGTATTNRGGLYDDQNNQWLIQFNSDADGLNEVTLYADGVSAAETAAVTKADYGTGLIMKDGTGTFRPVGMNVMPIYEIDAADTFDLAHNGMIWHKDSGGAVTFTCANDGNIPQGATYVVHNDDTEDLTIAQGSGVTIYWLAGGLAPTAGNVTVKQGGIVTVYKYTDTEFWIWGSKEAVGGIANVVEDTTPQLGGPLDMNGENIQVGATTRLLNAPTLRGTVNAGGTADNSGVGSYNGYSINNDIMFMHNGTAAGIYDEVNNAWRFRFDTNRSPSGTGVTSSAQVYGHASTGPYDVGFNLLPIFNEDVSDTLEAGHCGKVYFKDGTANITLTLDTGTDFPEFGVVTIINGNSTGNITVARSTATLYYLDGSTRSVGTSNRTVGPGGVATLWRESGASDIYYIWGSGIT